MSNALAIASVTAVLKDLLDNAVIDRSISTAVGAPVKVTASPPGLIEINGDISTQLNLFLYHISPNASWRNAGLPSRDGQGERLTNPPLALDLYYLLTAYGKSDFEIEILLGYAVQMLHENPVLTRDAIRKTLAQPSPVSGRILPPPMSALSASDLADQVELIKITQHSMSTEEISKLWSAFQAKYFPSVAYHVSVVLIESAYPARAPLPVLTRGSNDRGVIAQPDLIPPFPTLLEVHPPNQQPSAYLGDVLIISGHHLDGDSRLLFKNPRLKDPIEVIQLIGRSATEIRVKLPDIADDPQAPIKWPAGFYTVEAIISKTGQSPRITNELSFSLAPQITNPTLPINVSRNASGDATLVISCKPNVRPEQSASLVLGSILIQAELRQAPNSLTFIIKKAIPGEYYMRLRIDGVESLLVNRAVTPPVFDTTQKMIIT